MLGSAASSSKHAHLSKVGGSCAECSGEGVSSLAQSKQYFSLVAAHSMQRLGKAPDSRNPSRSPPMPHKQCMAIAANHPASCWECGLIPDGTTKVAMAVDQLSANSMNQESKQGAASARCCPSTMAYDATHMMCSVQHLQATRQEAAVCII